MVICQRLHYYERQFDVGADEWSDTYWLTPIDAETFALAMEAWEIWRRWETAFHQGQTTLPTRPALPQDRARSDELAAILLQRLNSTAYLISNVFTSDRRRPSHASRGCFSVRRLA